MKEDLTLQSSTDAPASPVKKRGDGVARARDAVSPLRRIARHLRDSNLRVSVDTPIPASLPVGRGQALVVAGWCYHPAERIAGLEILVNGAPHRISIRGLPRPDVLRAQAPDRDPRRHSYHSGFRTFVPFQAVTRPTPVELQLRARLASGTRCLRALGAVELQPPSSGTTPDVLAAGRPTADPLVAICMTACNPPLALFHAQVDSIRAQTHGNWTCVIVDDASRPDVFRAMQEVLAGDRRFRIHRNPDRLGFYHNFERCLGLVPPDAEFVALSDHDDRWHPDKLEALLAGFRPGTTLVYSDMNIVDEEGRVLATTYWTTRRNNHTRFDSLLLANTITGAASMFPRALLDYLLPFPPAVGHPFHDHWIGSVALALGDVGYVDRPLYDYVQHRDNVLGHHAPRLRGLAAGVRAWWMGLGAPDAGNGFLRSRAGALKGRWRATYEADVLRLQLIAILLEMRCGHALIGRKLQALRRIQRMDESVLAFAWLALRGLAPRGPGNVTLGSERKLAGAILWRRLAALRAAYVGRLP